MENCTSLEYYENEWHLHTHMETALADEAAINNTNIKVPDVLAETISLLLQPA